MIHWHLLCLANGVHLVGRSFKYHRPRGILSSGSEEPNALVRVGKGAYAEPNLRATQIEIFDGLYAESQNRLPNCLWMLVRLTLCWLAFSQLVFTTKPLCGLPQCG